MLSHIAILMENQPGALSRVVGLFSQRGYNIDSLSVAPTQDPTLSRLTMTTSENSEIINQILRQLFKLVDIKEIIARFSDGSKFDRSRSLFN